MIPNKSNFKFQELTPITGIKPYVIRFWETEFSDIAPTTSDSGQKLYARKDVEAILKIKKLLFEDKMTIPQAKAVLQNAEPSPVGVTPETNFLATAKTIIIEALDTIQEIRTRRNW